MSRVVFAVESGDYSEHVLHALFETQELAQAYVEALVRGVVAYEIDHWETAPLEAEAEGNAVRARLSVEPYQLWDALPVVASGPLYDQDHTEPSSSKPDPGTEPE